MAVDDGIKYSVTMQTETQLSYEDGFSDGYSRAWQECWDFMLEKINDERFKKEKPDGEKNDPA